MKTTENITITDGRLNRALKQRINPYVSQTATKIVNEAQEKSMPRLGKVTKIYPYLDKAEVKLFGSKKKVLCRLPHNYAGDIIDFHTPQGTREYCEKLNEPCIIPLGAMHCIVLKIHEKDSSEYFITNYYNPKEITGISLPKPGNARLICRTSTKETYLEFGMNGFNVVSTKKPKTKYGEFKNDDTEVDYADAENVYTKEEVYTKKEVDDLIAQKIGEALENKESDEGDDNGTTN